jgi:hypothetical protein
MHQHARGLNSEEVRLYLFWRQTPLDLALLTSSEVDVTTVGRLVTTGTESLAPIRAGA